MLIKKKTNLLCLLLSCLLLLCGCEKQYYPAASVNVVFEESDQTEMVTRTHTVKRGEDLTVTLILPEGKRLAEVSYEYWSAERIQRKDGKNQLQLTLYDIDYPLSVRLSLGNALETSYVFADETIHVSQTSARLRTNTLLWDESRNIDGRVAIGWSTAQDGSGTYTGFGCRPDREEDGTLTLYPMYAASLSEEDLAWEETEAGAVITACHANGDLVIPDTLGGLPVIGIRKGAFGRVQAEKAVFPASLSFIEEGAFEALSVKELYLFDALTEVSDASFGTLSVHTLHINACLSPVWCGSYFDTFTEKMDRLAEIRDQKKIILLGGSSVRFGFDCAMLEKAFDGYEAVNMGVYAYAGMRAECDVIRQYIGEGDLILSMPQLDAIEEQFGVSASLEKEHFAMMESNWDLLSLLELTEYTGIFDAFHAFQQEKAGLSAAEYTMIPADYDEDREIAASPSYDRWGDYILHRPANVTGQLFGIKRASYEPGDFSQEVIASINRLYDRFAEKGAVVYYLWSPRSERSVTSGSDAQSAAALEDLLRQQLHAAVLGSAEDAFWDAYYFFGTDNHLTSEGAVLHTQQVIKRLREALQEGGV